MTQRDELKKEILNRKVELFSLEQQLRTLSPFLSCYRFYIQPGNQKAYSYAETPEQAKQIITEKLNAQYQPDDINPHRPGWSFAIPKIEALPVDVAAGEVQNIFKALTAAERDLLIEHVREDSQIRWANPTER